ncbi:MAG: hypothetical protein IT349_17550 [Candidatus Eisenbacteria bacterium]|nr:hypothetical protein [Candidatus Eisenbacteria bacterium]
MDRSEKHDGLVRLDGELYACIPDPDQLAPFLMSIPSAGDLWMYLTSRGGLTAGRRDPGGALFPYETADKLADAHLHSGPITALWVNRQGEQPALWRPFCDDPTSTTTIRRTLYKSASGSRVVFEEIHQRLGLGLRASWAASDRYGWVRTVRLQNLGAASLGVEVLDGLRNLLPFGVPLPIYQRASSLVDAYKQTDLDPESRLAVFSLSSVILDRPEAAEELRGSIAWRVGGGEFDLALSAESIRRFLCHEPWPETPRVTGVRGCYLTRSRYLLEAGADVEWHVVVDTGRTQSEVSDLVLELRTPPQLALRLAEDLRENDRRLVRIVAAADGLQVTGQPVTAVHHFANVLYNGMRGGVFHRNHEVGRHALDAFFATRNRPAQQRATEFLAALPETLPAPELIDRAAGIGDPDLERLCLEYLPLYFGRRHGDPSRPWNQFRIQVRDRDGREALRYEGNWRDIFQNWEALAVSFPAFLPGIVAKFLNASTADGWNPYRITRDGIDWEVPDPDDPWSCIGYWGDHQIVYLLRLLEAEQRFAPGRLAGRLEQRIFAHADVPYRLRSYRRMLANRRETIDFDHGLAERIARRVERIGTDGKLVCDPDGRVIHVSLLEKLLIPALCKLSNLVPGGGIWMNTQRPEWNDANNALVGDGISVVTLCYLRRYLAFLSARLAEAGAGSTHELTLGVTTWAEELRNAFAAAPPHGARDARDDRRLLDCLGVAYEHHRERLYAGQGLDRSQRMNGAELAALLDAALLEVDAAIRVNRRPDGLYHAYNLLALEPESDTLEVRPLYAMLEGQVAALSSGLVGAEEAVQLIDALFASPLYLESERSFLLYPERRLPGFLEKNRIAPTLLEANPLLRELIATGEEMIVVRDSLVGYRFHPDLRNARDLARDLDQLAQKSPWTETVALHRAEVLELFEAVFQHRSFTGRSGTMYGYEGLGCIYWHMVAKLLLAVQEVALRAEREGAPKALVATLFTAYGRIRRGLGFEKSAREFGAFPTDPYSHTPRHAGAQQPGMTGQVKEEILARWGELGLVVASGTLRFEPRILQAAEFLSVVESFRFVHLDGEAETIKVPTGALAFSFCQVPILYHLSEGAEAITLHLRDGDRRVIPGRALDTEWSGSIFDRRGVIRRIEVQVPRSGLRLSGR